VQFHCSIFPIVIFETDILLEFYVFMLFLDYRKKQSQTVEFELYETVPTGRIWTVRNSPDWSNLNERSNLNEMKQSQTVKFKRTFEFKRNEIVPSGQI
jgi:hypothetical protein